MKTVSWPRIETEAVLAVGSFLLFGAIALVVLWHKIPADNEKYAMLMLGALIGIVKDTFGRYFQATKGAQEQRKENAAVVQALADTVAASAPVSGGVADKVNLEPGDSVQVAAVESAGSEDPSAAGEVPPGQRWEPAS